MAEPKVYSAGTKTAGKVCTICQSPVIAGEHIVYCPDCGLPFHKACWRENRGCSAYGCQSAPQTVKPGPEAEPATGAWGDEKTCPACGRLIRAQALKCRFCGAKFDTRRPMSRREYANREYAGNEAASAHLAAIGLFLLAASGCLAPVAIVPLALLIFRGRVFNLEYRRMAGAWKGLVLCSFGISCLLLVMLVALIAIDGLGIE